MAKFKIYSDNAAFQSIETLKYNRNKRHRRRLFFVEGVRNINAAAHFGWRFNAFIYDGGAELSRWAQGMLEDHGYADCYELTTVLMKKLSSKQETSEIAAMAHMRDGTGDGGVSCVAGGNRRKRRQVAALRLTNDSGNSNPGGRSGNKSGDIGASENPIFVLFDRPSNKGNLGSIMRSCDAFGVGALFRTGHSVDFYDPEVIASSMGSFFAVPFYSLDTSDEIDALIHNLKQQYPGLIVVGTSERGEKNISDINLTVPVLFLIGNETDGLSWKLSQISDVTAAIPMSRQAFASSLNVSCAATALLYETTRQRSKLSGQH